MDVQQLTRYGYSNLGISVSSLQVVKFFSAIVGPEQPFETVAWKTPQVVVPLSPTTDHIDKPSTPYMSSTGFIQVSVSDISRVLPFACACRPLAATRYQIRSNGSLQGVRILMFHRILTEFVDSQCVRQSCTLASYQSNTQGMA